MVLFFDMKTLSLRAKTIFLNVAAITVSIAITAIIGVASIAEYGHNNVENTLALKCETGKNSINYYLKSVEQSVGIVSTLINEDLDNMSDEQYSNSFAAHIAKVENLFKTTAVNTNGVFTYYYRVSPKTTEDTGQLGFWYVQNDEGKFVSNEVTDISNDKNECLWFHIPERTLKAVWIPPYITDNLNAYVISYNVPVFRNGNFLGVAGIEIDYQTLGEQIDQIKMLNTGFAFIIENENCSFVYHPKIDVLKETEKIVVPDTFINSFRNGEHHVEYTFRGVKKHSYWLELSNGMSIVVAVPDSEVNSTWQHLTLTILLTALAIIVVFTFVSFLFARQITKPLKQLTLAAEEINRGNYKVELNYKGNDEIGVLTSTVNRLIKDLGEYITDLNSLAYADALTEVRNKSAFDLYIKEIQKRIDDPNDHVEFAIGIFDCDNLKDINDAYGHDKGNIYLRNSCNLMCRVFNKSVIYRIGGDEFAVILMGEDYDNREKLEKHFLEKSEEICAFAKEPWEQIRVSVGIANYDPEFDFTVEEVIIHADHLMYANKRSRKRRHK